MRSTTVALIVTLGLPATAVAQTVSGSAIGGIGPSGDPVPNYFIRPLIGPPSAGYPPRDPLPSFAIPPLIGPPSIGSLSPIGLPLPPIGWQPKIDADRPPGFHRRQTLVVWPSMYFMVPQIAVTMTPPPAPPAPVEREPATGTLILQVEPGTAQVFVDGYYVGTPDDFSAKGAGLALEIGPHRVDLNAPGHEFVSFDVRISRNQSIVYRGVLKPIEISPPPAPSTLKTPTTLYMIPGCYLGNVPPKQAELRSGCDATRALTFAIQ